MWGASEGLTRENERLVADVERLRTEVTGLRREEWMVIRVLLDP